jgi:hypothetical protein
MLVAFDTVYQVVVTGPETCPNANTQVRGAPESHLLTDGGVGTQQPTSSRHTPEHNHQYDSVEDAFRDNTGTRYECIVCGEPVTRNSTQNHGADSIKDVFDWFEHTNGDVDCFGDRSMGDSHRAAVELSAYRLAHASQRIQSNRCSADRNGVPLVEPEKRVTTPDEDQWIDTDVHLSVPRVAVEVFSAVSQLDLRRRLSILFDAGYDAYLVFDSDGRYDPSEIEAWLQRVAAVPVRVGRFNKSRVGSGDPASLTLGTRLSASVIDPSSLAGPDVPVFLQ